MLTERPTDCVAVQATACMWCTWGEGCGLAIPMPAVWQEVLGAPSPRTYYTKAGCRE